MRSRPNTMATSSPAATLDAIRAAQRALADDLTSLVHGADETARATAAARALFGQGDLRDLDEATLAAALAEAPHATIGRLGATVGDLMAMCGLVASKSEARRAIEGGGAYLNNVKVTDIDAVPTADDVLHGRFLVLRRGKRTVGGIEVTG